MPQLSAFGLVVITACSVLLSACGGPRVRYDQAANADLTGFVAAGWQWQQPIWPSDGESSDSNVDAAETAQRQRFENAIANELIALGSNKNANSPWLIALELGDRQRISTSGSSFSFGMGTGRRGRYGGVGVGTGTDVTDYDERTLSIIISKKSSEKETEFVWSGSASWSQNAKSPEAYDKEAQRAAAALSKTLREKTAVGAEAVEKQ